MICRILGEIHVRILAGQLGRHLRLDDATDVCSHAVLRSPFTVLSMGEGIESVCTICALTVGTFKMLKGCHAFTEHGKHQEPQQQHAKEIQKYNKQGQGHFRPEAIVKEKSSRICTKKHWLIFGDNVFLGMKSISASVRLMWMKSILTLFVTHKQINKITRLTIPSERNYWLFGFPKRSYSQNKKCRQQNTQKHTEHTQQNEKYQTEHTQQEEKYNFVPEIKKCGQCDIMRIPKQINKITRLADISKRYYWSPGFPKRNHSPN
ncbi:hypothetical protein LXL04_034193 [Taraxacum kok-saghyz]